MASFYQLNQPSNLFWEFVNGNLEDHPFFGPRGHHRHHGHCERRSSQRESPVQILGHICRAVSHDNFHGIPLCALQTLFILLSPPLYTASIYMTLGRTVAYLEAEHLSMIPVQWMTKIFATGDVASFLLQCAVK
ncbi:hypothetical protein PDIDSM_6095 [Penicillium digitatum]|nr:hypothetical protein PDIDSM_6095 [Penicillium digitatum]